MCPGGRYAGLDHPAGAGAGDLRPAFDVLDADRDGRISRDDLKSFYAIAAMIAAADADRDGFVQYHEFEGLLAPASAATSAMEDAFRLMDRDGDGKVGFEDLKDYLGWAGMPVDDDEVRAMISVAGDGDGGVGLQALARILAVDFEAAA
ncbi:hypothetical protein QYE76_068433 [Lolium multiflorum]|uniref:EF-hand domain-containing protein n=1 Tax=Lolium multiflorum TaxID=4521 RepID=A0AAD8WBY1_LOLMU|nr:hypothetical protein QYE76_068433 [Lolium multiflorum]